MHQANDDDRLPALNLVVVALIIASGAITVASIVISLIALTR